MARQKYHTISHKAAAELIYSQRVNGRGQIFGVSFERRTDSEDGIRKAGTLETLYGRFNVRKHVKEAGWRHPDGEVRSDWVEGARPAGAPYDRADHQLVCIFITGRKWSQERGGDVFCYRCIPLDSLRWLKLDKIIYRVGRPAPVQH